MLVCGFVFVPPCQESQDFQAGSISCLRVIRAAFQTYRVSYALTLCLSVSMQLLSLAMSAVAELIATAKARSSPLYSLNSPDSSIKSLILLGI